MITISPQQLKRIMPNASLANTELYAPLLTSHMLKWHIDTYEQVTAFIANVGHESGELKWVEEIASGAAYEGRRDLGNTEPGDGKRYKGRGLIQLTGRLNYVLIGFMLEQDFINNPEKLKEPKFASESACAFWWNNYLDRKATSETQFRQVVKIINGGYNGMDDRSKLYARARDVLAEQK
ncbi:putative chitinase [Achromobacter phage JWF]|uniref:endolysin n=1 Tax=Achromobacter phage JWF TaxID=1589748 RepID=UPI000588E09C|nr:endolysin [Achromobacter phage JWF]AJD82926.1 putative chitinase [Achromobacter phage JWF]